MYFRELCGELPNISFVDPHFIDWPPYATCDEPPADVGDGQQIDKAQITKLASMPSREQMLAQLAAGLQSPLAGFLGALSGVMYTFVGALEGLKAQREGATDAAPAGA